MYHLDKPVCLLFQGQYNIRILTIVLKTMLGKDKIEIFNLPKINLLKINSTLKQIVNGINSIPDVPLYYQEKEENNENNPHKFKGWCVFLKILNKLWSYNSVIHNIKSIVYVKRKNIHVEKCELS